MSVFFLLICLFKMCNAAMQVTKTETFFISIQVWTEKVGIGQLPKL